MSGHFILLVPFNPIVLTSFKIDFSVNYNVEGLINRVQSNFEYKSVNTGH